MTTLKQEATVQDLLENTGKPISQAMLDNGYAPSTAKNPKELTESKGWQQLMDRYLPDKELAKKHKEFLNSKKIRTTYKKGELQETEEFTDPSAVRALDMAYKLKDKYPKQGTESPTGNTYISFNQFVIKLKEREKDGATG